MESRDKQKIGSIRTFLERLERLNLDEPSNEVFYFRGHAYSGRIRPPVPVTSGHSFR